MVRSSEGKSLYKKHIIFGLLSANHCGAIVSELRASGKTKEQIDNNVTYQKARVQVNEEFSKALEYGVEKFSYVEAGAIVTSITSANILDTVLRRQLEIFQDTPELMDVDTDAQNFRWFINTSKLYCIDIHTYSS